MNRRGFCRAVSAAAAAAVIPLGNVSAYVPDMDLEFDLPVIAASDPLSDREKHLVNEMVALFASRYRLQGKPLFHIANNSIFDDYRPGQTVLGLTRADKEVRLESRQYQTIGVINGKRVVRRVAPLRKLAYFGRVLKSGKPTLWESKFLKDPGAEMLFKRAVLHEFGCNCFCDSLSKELVHSLNRVDINSRAYERGGEGRHPAHASYLSYFHVVDANPDWRGLPMENAMRSFGEVFALRELGLLPKTKDIALNTKIDLVYGVMDRARRKR